MKEKEKRLVKIKTVRMPAELAERLELLAKRHWRDTNAEIVWALKNYVESCDGTAEASRDTARRIARFLNRELKKHGQGIGGKTLEENPWLNEEGE